MGMEETELRAEAQAALGACRKKKIDRIAGQLHHPEPFLSGLSFSSPLFGHLAVSVWLFISFRGRLCAPLAQPLGRCLLLLVLLVAGIRPLLRIPLLSVAPDLGVSDCTIQSDFLPVS